MLNLSLQYFIMLKDSMNKLIICHVKIYSYVQECGDDSQDSSEIISVLLRAGSKSTDHQDKEGRTPLIWASSAGNCKAVQILIKHKADSTLADRDGLTGKLFP